MTIRTYSRADLTSPIPDAHFIGGAWSKSASGKTFETIDPSTEEVLGEIARGDARDIEAAVEAANQAQKGDWRRLSPAGPHPQQGLLPNHLQTLMTFGHLLSHLLWGGRVHLLVALQAALESQCSICKRRRPRLLSGVPDRLKIKGHEPNLRPWKPVLVEERRRMEQGVDWMICCYIC